MSGRESADDTPCQINPHTGRPFVARSVGARARERIPLALVAVALDRESGELHALAWGGERLITTDEVLTRLASRPAGNARAWGVATTDTAAIFAALRDHGERIAPGLRARGTIRRSRPYLRTGGHARGEKVTASLASFAWERRARSLVLDPAQFTDAPPEEVLDLIPPDARGGRYVPEPGLEERLAALFLWGRDLVSWCDAAGVQVRPTRGGVAAQLLTDARWWRPRRKVPKLLNEIARPEMPGNFYRVVGDLGDNYRQAREYDQRAAHHAAAAAIAFTDPDTIRGSGFLSRRHDPAPPLFLRPSDARWDEITTRPGLFYLRVRVSPETAAQRVQLPQLAQAGEHTIPVYSTEWALVTGDPGVTVLGLVAAITSEPRPADAPAGLNGIARWALGETDAAGERRRRWLKGLLLSVYGLLAQPGRPIATFSTAPTRGGELQPVVLGGRLVDVYVAESTRAPEAGYVNVIDRGLIEADTRRESVTLARTIDARHAGGDSDEELLAIYADAVLTSGGTEFDLANLQSFLHWASERDWRSRPRSNLVMIAANAYTSDEATKRPGVPRNAPDRRNGAGFVKPQPKVEPVGPPSPPPTVAYPQPSIDVPPTPRLEP